MNKKIYGVEGIIIMDNCIILGMQKEKRWYKNEKLGAVIKTIGGKIEKEDNGDPLNALKREMLEEICGISDKNFRIKEKPLFNIETGMSDINSFEHNSGLTLNANFYLININEEVKLTPNDLPFIFKIPLKKILELDFNETIDFNFVSEFAIGDYNNKPEEVCLMVPLEVKEFLSNYE